jgi:hypothetical protein
MPCKNQNDRKTAGQTLLTPARSFRDDLRRCVREAGFCISLWDFIHPAACSSASQRPLIGMTGQGSCICLEVDAESAGRGTGRLSADLEAAW